VELDSLLQGDTLEAAEEGMHNLMDLRLRWVRGLVLGLAWIDVSLVGCGRVEPEVASLATADSLTSAEVTSVSLDQYGRTQVLQECLVDAGLPALLMPVEGGEAEIGWVEDHELLARDFEQVTTVLEGPNGEIDSTTRDAFGNAKDSQTGTLAPALWVDGVDYTETWTLCLESSGYTNPTGYLEQDPGELLAFSQGRADAANDWMVCAREQGLPGLVDAKADASGMAPGPHAEIPFATDSALLRTVVQACPIFSEDYFRRLLEGDPTLDDDVEAGRIKADPLVLVEQPDGLQDDDYDFESEEGRHYLELGEILYADERAFEEKYGREQAQRNAAGDGDASTE
jgi:hypothetical protein